MRLFRSRRSAAPTKAPVSDNTVLDAALRVLISVPGATLADVGARVGVDAREMRTRFTSREALIERVVMRGARRIGRAAVLEDGSPAEQIALLVARLWDDQEPVAKFITLGVRAHLREPVEEALAPARELLSDAVKRGAEDGTLRADISPQTVAWLIEQSVMDCLEALARQLWAGEDGRMLAMRQALATSGLSWSDAVAVSNTVTARIS